MCFDFRIIMCLDGTEIIDRRRKTFYHQLSPVQMIQYIDMDAQLVIMDRMERKERIGTERKRKIRNNPLWKLACACGLV